MAILTGCGLAKIITRIHDLTQTQIAMDHCTGQFILNLRAATLTVEASYSRMEKYRLATVGACALVASCPPALEAFQFVAKIEKGIQTIVKAYWKKQQVIWNSALRQTCNIPFGVSFSSGSFPPYDFPELRGDLSDLASLQESTYSLHASPRQLTIRIGTLVSTAKMERNRRHGWNVRWSE